MKVILREDVKTLGKTGDLLEVKDGYARNYLLPRKLAVRATVGSVQTLAHQKREIAHVVEKRKKLNATLKEQLQNRSVTIARAVGKEERLYGSVTARDIEAALLEESIAVDRKRILVEEPIKTLGVYPIAVQLDEDERIEIKVWVVAK